VPELPPGHPPVDPGRREQIQKLIEERRKKRGEEQQQAATPGEQPAPSKPKGPVDAEGHCIGDGPNDRPKDINLFHGWLGTKDEIGDRNDMWKKAVAPPPAKGSKEWWFWRLTPYPFRYDNHEDPCDRYNQPVPLFANIINSGVLFFVLVRCSRKPIAEGLAKRKKTIMAEFDKAAEIKRDARQRLDRYEEELEHLDEKLVALRQQYADEGEKEEARVRAHVQQRREAMLADAEFRVVQESKAARDELSRAALHEALAAAEQIVKTSITPEDHARLAREYLDQVSVVLRSGGRS
jgi:F-type H+-transporting ATPase subunit b